MITDDVALPSMSPESVHSNGCTVSCPWAGVYNLSEPQFPPGGPAQLLYDGREPTLVDPGGAGQGPLL